MREHVMKGAAREAAVIAGLLQRGFEVYAAAHGNFSCDLIALKDDTLLKIEVKGASKGRVPTGPISRNGKAATGIHGTRFDILATVDYCWQVHYNRSSFSAPSVVSVSLTGITKFSKHTTKKNIARSVHTTTSLAGWKGNA